MAQTTQMSQRFSRRPGGAPSRMRVARQQLVAAPGCWMARPRPVLRTAVMGSGRADVLVEGRQPLIAAALVRNIGGYHGPPPMMQTTAQS